MTTTTRNITLVTGRTDAEVRARLVERAKANPLAAHGEVGNGRGRGDNVTSTERGNGTDYLLRRLAREQAKTIGQGTRTDLQHGADGTKLSRGTNSRDYLLRRLARDAETCDEPVALDKIDGACRGKPGNPTGRNQHTGTFDNVKDSSVEAPTGNSRDAALRRLRDQRPDLHARVLNGELSPHAAMVEAGFRKRPTPIDRLWSAWRAATPAERASFLAEATR